ncbi:MAG TPA: MFS transporter [Candidatus Sumerlaeota bacterium]|nr:MFS transporter [Candidatus Sumerlaeota bacterium]
MNSLSPEPASAQPKSRQKIPGSIWALGMVSLFMDVSSELIHSLLPLFMTTVLGVTMTSVGVVEGIAEATALVTKVFSGTLSDYLGKRKLLTLIGYGGAALTKPLFPLANSLGLVVAARFIDRIGKGIRGAPRDALIGDLAPPEIRGACFGLRQSLDTVGAFVGPLLAIFFMWLFASNIRSALWIAVIPAFISVALLAWGVQEPPSKNPKKGVRSPIRLEEIRRIGSAYWQLVGVSAVLTLARFSEAFLILKAQSTGMRLALVPTVMVVMNIVYSLSAYPVGILSDRMERKNLLPVGIGFLIAADGVLAIANNFWLLALGVSLWGLHLGFTQGVFATMVTDTTPAQLRGTAYGVYNLVCGLAMLLASVVAGALWDGFGAAATFLTGAVFAALSLAGVVVLNRRKTGTGPAPLSPS